VNKNFEKMPGVLRAEAIYVPNQPFNTFDMTDSDAVVRKNYAKYLIAYDFSNVLYFQWHNTAPFNITLEHTGEFVQDASELQYNSNYATEMKSWNPVITTNINTNWRYNQISTSLIISYMFWGHSGLIMPIVSYTPPIFNQRLTFEARYINVFGDNGYTGLGILRKKDMAVLTTQFNF
jgi:hypothetical protein